MKSYYIVLLLFILLFFDDINSQIKKGIYRYRDYKIVVDARHNMLDNDYKFILLNGFIFNSQDGNKLREDVLYYVSYKYENKNASNNKYSRIPVDTIRIMLKPAQMDSIFILTKKLFNIKYEINYSDDPLGDIVPINDGFVADVIFDLGWTNGRLERFINDANTDKEYNSDYKKLVDRLFLLIGKRL
jgi:hypothetical protein